AELVIDATGRHSKLPSWLRAIGAASPVEEAEESAFVYYTRFFHVASGGVPAYRSGIITHFHTFSLLLLPGDSNTWSVTVFTIAGDAPLRALRDPAHGEPLVGACPAHAHWLDGEPIRTFSRSAALQTATAASSWMVRRLQLESSPSATRGLARTR